MHPSLRSRFVEQARADGLRQKWRALIAEHGTPLLVLDPAKVGEQYRRFTDAMPKVHPHYAVKAAPHPAVLHALAAAGAGFDVATDAEVDLIRSLGIPMQRCIHTHPIKKTATIVHAYEAGVRTFVVDNPAEAQKFNELPDDIEVLVRLAFRNPEAKSDLSTKFGVQPQDAELLVKHVLAAGVRFAGFSFHVGSQGSRIEPYAHALRTTVDLAEQIRRTLGVRTGVIDIGGGFPVTYREQMPDIGDIGAEVSDALADAGDLTLLAEPGRFLVANAMTLLTTVVGTAVRDGRVWHYLDDGLYGAYSNILTEDVHPPIVGMAELDADPELGSVTLAGPTCDSIDVVARDYPMPELSLGDVVVSPMMGAYTTVTSSRFNGIGETKIVCVATN